MSVNTHISDIFFNGDNIDTFDYETGEWDRSELMLYAEELLDSLQSLGVESLPTPSELVQDYLDRI